eukprot:968786_1
MACACPCFGDEADAEEKPNQMIQLDGLGMLRLDTQHVGQGSQGARSAKWFYFGETDNRLAVVNMLLCITCFLMWILFISAASPYIWGANPSDTTNDRVKPNLAQLQQQHNDLVAKHQTMKKRIASYEEAEKSKEGKEENDTATEIKRLEEDHAEKLLDAHKSHEQEITNLKVSHKRVKTDKKKFRKALDDIQEAVDYKSDKLADLPVYVQNIRKSKKEAEKQLKEMKALSERWKPYALEKQAPLFEYSYRQNPNEPNADLLQEYPVLYKDFFEEKRKAAANDEVNLMTNGPGAEDELNDETRDANDAGGGGDTSEN